MKEGEDRVNFDKLLLDLGEHYERISYIAKNTDSFDKSFTKIYYSLINLAKIIVDLLKLRGIEVSEDDLASLLSKISEKKEKKMVKVFISGG
ncbi:MAG: hypothetical protein ACUVTD_09585 [Nitrososphaerales archaeon]